MPTKSATVVVIEDAPEIRILLEDLLANEGFRVIATDNGEDGVDLVVQEDADLVVLDLVLPGIDGFEACRRIREQSDAYVVMLTSKDAEIDKVVGLTVGADDYVTKPFSPPELVARLRAMLRRPRADEGSDSLRQHGDLAIDPDAREVRVADQPVELTRIEFDLLEALTDNPRQVKTREQLLNRIWGPGWVGEDHLVDVHMSKLRRKLGDDARTQRYVVTVRGVGYRMGDPAAM